VLVLLSASRIFADRHRSMIEMDVSINIRLAVNTTVPCDWLLGTASAVAARRTVGKKVTDAESNGFVRWVDAYSAVLMF